MIPVNDIGVVRDALARVKKAGGPLVTNSYAADDVLRKWISRRVLRFDAAPGVVVLLRRDRGFDHLYFTATDVRALSAMLESASMRSETMVVDVVVREDEASEVPAVLERAGFQLHAKLVRMTRVAAAQEGDNERPVDGSVEVARPADAQVIQEFLARLLDPFSEQLPTIEDVAEEASHGHVLLVRGGDGVGGVLVFKTTGLTSELRYWFVSARHRGEGIGAKLMRAFFDACRSSRRIVLWVVSDNADAMAKYSHYGFRRDGLADRILIRRGGRAT